MRVTAAASATLNMSVMTGAFSLTLTSHTLPPSSTGTTSCEVWKCMCVEGEGRVSVGLCEGVYECVKESGQTLHKFQIDA